MLGLDSKNVIDRIHAANEPVILPDLRQSIKVGAVGFTIVSVLMFSVWAFAGQWMYRNLGARIFYSLLGVGFMAGGGGAFAPILIGRNLGRFYILFVVSFFAYAAVWMICWFTLQAPGEWLATFAGPALMGFLFVTAFRANNYWQPVVGYLIAGHTLGYFIGEWLFYWEPLANRWGMLLWGITYGLGLGGGIGAALFWCQTDTRKHLETLVKPSEGQEPSTPSSD